MRKRSVRKGLAGLLSLTLTLGLCLGAAGSVSAAEVTEAEEAALTEVLQGEETTGEATEETLGEESEIVQEVLEEEEAVQEESIPDPLLAEETGESAQGEEDMSALADTKYYQGDVDVINRIIDNNFTAETNLGWKKNDPSSWEVKSFKTPSGAVYVRGISWEETGEGRRICAISCHYGSLKGALDVSKLTNLEELYCGWNQLTTLDVSGLTELNVLGCGVNQLTTLDVSGCTNLTRLDCEGNQLTTLDVSKLTNLTGLSCVKNQLQELNVSKLTNLKELICWRNQLTTLDVSGCTNLSILVCWENQLTTLDVSKLTNLTELNCEWNQLTMLDVSKLTNLTRLYCGGNQLTTLDVSKLTNLQSLECGMGNQLTTLDVSKLTNLTWLRCEKNQLQELDVSKLTNLTRLDCYGNQLTTLDVSKLTKLTELHCGDNALLSKLNITECKSLRGYGDYKDKVFDATNCPKLKEITAIGLDKNLFIEGENYDKGTIFRTTSETTTPETTASDPTTAQNNVFGKETKIEVKGIGRTETSLDLANQMKKALGKGEAGKFDAFILASGADYPDGLGVSALSIKMNAPVLIVMEGTEAKVKDYIKANLAVNGEVIISGGTGAVRKEMEDSLKGVVSGIKVERLEGIGRYETNMRTIEKCIARDTSKDELLVASGKGYADALSASATGKIIMIVGDKLRDDQKALLKKSGFGKITILGGEGAVSKVVENELKTVTGKTVGRIGGKGRVETANLVAEKYFPGSQVSVYTKADGFADGLAGGLLAHTLGAPMRLAFSGKDMTAPGKNMTLGGVK